MAWICLRGGGCSSSCCVKCGNEVCCPASASDRPAPTLRRGGIVVDRPRSGKEIRGPALSMHVHPYLAHGSHRDEPGGLAEGVGREQDLTGSGELLQPRSERSKRADRLDHMRPVAAKRDQGDLSGVDTDAGLISATARRRTLDRVHLQAEHLRRPK